MSADTEWDSSYTIYPTTTTTVTCIVLPRDRELKLRIEALRNHPIPAQVVLVASPEQMVHIMMRPYPALLTQLDTFFTALPYPVENKVILKTYRRCLLQMRAVMTVCCTTEWLNSEENHFLKTLTHASNICGDYNDLVRKHLIVGKPECNNNNNTNLKLQMLFPTSQRLVIALREFAKTKPLLIPTAHFLSRTECLKRIASLKEKISRLLLTSYNRDIDESTFHQLRLLVRTLMYIHEANHLFLTRQSTAEAKSKATTNKKNNDAKKTVAQEKVFCTLAEVSERMGEIHDAMMDNDIHFTRVADSDRSAILTYLKLDIKKTSMQESCVIIK